MREKFKPRKFRLGILQSTQLRLSFITKNSWIVSWIQEHLPSFR